MGLLPSFKMRKWKKKNHPSRSSQFHFTLSGFSPKMPSRVDSKIFCHLSWTFWTSEIQTKRRASDPKPTQRAFSNSMSQSGHKASSPIHPLLGNKNRKRREEMKTKKRNCTNKFVGITWSHAAHTIKYMQLHQKLHVLQPPTLSKSSLSSLIVPVGHFFIPRSHCFSEECFSHLHVNVPGTYMYMY